MDDGGETRSPNVGEAHERKLRQAERRLSRELEDAAPPDRRRDQDQGDADTGVDDQEGTDG
jgi:hypothetical protein